MKDCGTILVVDSDDASRLTAVQVAVRLGYDARPTPTGDELLDRLGHDRPALAIVEVELPGHANGLEVMRQLHDEFGGDLPVILVSAVRVDAFDRATGLMLGADDYLSKPLDGGELLARVKRSLRRSAPVSERQRTPKTSESQPARAPDPLAPGRRAHPGSDRDGARHQLEDRGDAHPAHPLEAGRPVESAGRGGGVPARPRRARSPRASSCADRVGMTRGGFRRPSLRSGLARLRPLA